MMEYLEHFNLKVHNFPKNDTMFARVYVVDIEKFKLSVKYILKCDFASSAVEQNKYHILDCFLSSISMASDMISCIEALLVGHGYANEFGDIGFLPDHKIEVGNMYSNFSEREDEIAEFDEKIVLCALHIYFHSMDWYAMMRSVYAPELYSSVTPEERKKALKLFDEFCLSRGVEIEDPFIPDPEFFEAFPEMRSYRV